MHTLVAALPPRIESHVVCARTENLDQFAVPHIHVARARLGDFALPRRWRRSRVSFLARQIRRTGARVLHSHFGDVGWEDRAAARHSVQHVVGFYGYDATVLVERSPEWRRRYRDLFDAAACVLCEGQAMRARIADLGCPASKLRLHRLGVPLELIQYRPRSWSGVEPLRVLIAGTFREKKGIPAALGAVARLSATLPLRVTLVGDADLQPRSQTEKARILDALQREPLCSIVEWKGTVRHDRLLQLMYQHHLLLAASQRASDGDTEGGLPVVLLEAAATGLPMVSTCHADIPDLVQHGVTGLLAGEGDADGLAQHIRWLAEHVGAWPRLLAAARERVERDFDARIQGERLADLYQTLDA
jgi:colanic acid/amylovoran biosynthesis glycosyltransferase